jgi:antitoxin ChpS
MMSIPKAILDVLSLGPNTKVGMFIEDGRLIVDPHPRKKYTLEELLAQCDPNAEFSDEDRAWMNSSPVGREEI